MRRKESRRTNHFRACVVLCCAMGLLTILKKLKQKEKELRVLILCVCLRACMCVCGGEVCAQRAGQCRENDDSEEV
jgi:hypothetical protein